MKNIYCSLLFLFLAGNALPSSNSTNQIHIISNAQGTLEIYELVTHKAEGNTGRKELVLSFKNKNIIHASYDVCGQISGVILEGISSHGEVGQVVLDNGKTLVLEFNHSQKIATIKGSNFAMKITFSEAVQMANSIIDYYNKSITIENQKSVSP